MNYNNNSSNNGNDNINSKINNTGSINNRKKLKSPPRNRQEIPSPMIQSETRIEQNKKQDNEEYDIIDQM